MLNIALGTIIIGITVTIHGYGTMFWVKVLSDKFGDLTGKPFDKTSVWALILTALFLLLLNFVEAIIWGVTYYYHYGISQFSTLEESIYFSIVTYTTLGYGEITLSAPSRILSGIEAMNGVLLLGWSTTMMFSVMQVIVTNSRAYYDSHKKED